MPKKSNAFEKEQAYREAFLARLGQTLASPATAWPTVRCWTKPALDRVFRQVRDELLAEGLKSPLPHSALLEWLCHLRLAAPLPVEGESVFLLEIGASADAEADSLELLMAGRPAGVVCYFSAVAFHALTTQIVAHHHVAEVRPPVPRLEAEPEAEIEAGPSEASAESGAGKPRGFGKALFHYQGVPFYATRRSARLVPGVQTRGYGPRARIRITTLEQTLLDTLYKPFHCGGPEVVFEAWHEAVASRRIDEERVVDYMRSMQYPATARRLGVMLEIVGGAPGAELRRLLQESREAIDRLGVHARISLLPGVEYQNLNEPWLVNAP